MHSNQAAPHTKLQRDSATRVSTRPWEHMPSGASAADDLEFRRWNLARRLCLAARAADRPDDAAAAMARLGRILRDGAADPARRKLKSGSAAFEAKLGSLGLADVVAYMKFAGFYICGEQGCSPSRRRRWRRRWLR